MNSVCARYVSDVGALHLIRIYNIATKCLSSSEEVSFSQIKEEILMQTLYFTHQAHQITTLKCFLQRVIKNIMHFCVLTRMQLAYSVRLYALEIGALFGTSCALVLLKLPSLHAHSENQCLVKTQLNNCFLAVASCIMGNHTNFQGN